MQGEVLAEHECWSLPGIQVRDGWGGPHAHAWRFGGFVGKQRVASGPGGAAEPGSEVDGEAESGGERRVAGFAEGAVGNEPEREQDSCGFLKFRGAILPGRGGGLEHNYWRRSDERSSCGFQPKYSTPKRKFLQPVVSLSRPCQPGGSSGMGSATAFSTVMV